MSSRAWSSARDRAADHSVCEFVRPSSCDRARLHGRLGRWLDPRGRALHEGDRSGATAARAGGVSPARPPCVTRALPCVISEERLDAAEVASIVAAAAGARNGRKVILSRCAPTIRPRSALQLAREIIAAGDVQPRVAASTRKRLFDVTRRPSMVRPLASAAQGSRHSRRRARSAAGTQRGTQRPRRAPPGTRCSGASFGTPSTAPGSTPAR